jgi:hypothetical protein
VKLIERPKKIFFAYTMDCERIVTETYLKNGTPSWEMSEKAILGMADVLRKKNAVKAGGFYPTPATAEKHKRVFLDLKAEGFDIGCQFHCDSFRNGEYKKFLGQYECEDQREILTLAKQDWEQALGLPLETFRCGFLSANDYTFPILNDLGVRQSSSSLPGRHQPSIAAYWAGAYAYPHHASRKCRLVCGDLDLYEVPITYNPYRWLDEAHTAACDLRPDRGAPIEFYREMLDAYTEQMLRGDPPIKAIIAITHNTIDYLDPENPKRKIMESQIVYVKELAAKNGYEFVPASLEDIHREADRIGSY